MKRWSDRNSFPFTNVLYHKNAENSRLVRLPGLRYTTSHVTVGATGVNSIHGVTNGTTMEGMYMAENWLEQMNRQTWLTQVRETNQYTQKYGLTLSEQDTQLLLAERMQVLKTEQRVEFGRGILPQIIYMFCDSDFISQSNYVESLMRLQEIFYLYKNEMLDEITDDELLQFMKEQFETVCFGDFDYLEGTCLDIFAQAVRAGYRGYEKTQGKGEFEKFDIVKRWDRQLYQDTLKELCWR